MKWNYALSHGDVTHFLGIVKLSKTTVPIKSICEEIDRLQIKRTYLSSKWLVGIVKGGTNVHYHSWIHLTSIQNCPSQIHSCDWHWAEGAPPSTVTGQAERRSWMSWRGSCVYSLFYSLLLWMNPRVKEASKKMSGSLKSLDVAPAQRTIEEASQAPTLGVHTRQPGIHMLALLLTFPLSCVACGCTWSLSCWRDELVKPSS